MTDINMTVKVAEELISFMDTIREIGITVDDVQEIGRMFPGIINDLKIIDNWRQGISMSDTIVVKEETGKVAVIETSAEKKKTETDTTSKRGKYKRLTHDVVESICKLIEDKYTGRKVKRVAEELAKKFPYAKRTIESFLMKKTYKEISDKYFLCVDGIIKGLEPTDIFTDKPSDINRITNMLNQNNNDVMSTITDKMSRNDIIKVAVVRWSMFVNGTCKDLGSGVKEIFCMEALHNNSKANNKQIAEAIKKKYNIEVSESIITSVRNGKSYKNLRRF